MTDGTTVPSEAVYDARLSPWRDRQATGVGSFVDALRGAPANAQREFWHSLADQLAELPGFDPAAAAPPLQREQIAVGSTVYYARFGDRVKIGTTRRTVQQRLTHVPHDELLATEPGDRTVEADRHWEFRAYRIKGEWFKYEGRLAEHIKALRNP